MFLNLLDEANKERFIKLCGCAIYADGIVADEEKELALAYCREMNVEQRVPDNSAILDDVLKELDEGATEREKNIIAFEILGMFLSDNDYAKEEEIMMQKIIEQLHIEREKFGCMLSLLNIYKSVYEEICNVVVF
jgi:hypothetical protein